jgi:hypothetical protein
MRTVCRFQWALLLTAALSPILYADIPSAEIETTGIIAGVDAVNREVILKENDGNVLALQVSPDVPHLNFLRQGDKVVARYVQSVALALGNPHDQLPAPDKVQAASPDGKGPPVLVNTQTLTAIAEQIDRKQRTVTLRTPQGNRITVVVSPDDKTIDRLKPGDAVLAQYTEGLLFDIQKA